MSYLNNGNMPIAKLGKGTISLWFRVPAASMEAVASVKQDDLKNIFDGILPLCVFGPQGFADGNKAAAVSIGTFSLHILVYNVSSGTWDEYSGGHFAGFPVDPSPYPDQSYGVTQVTSKNEPFYIDPSIIGVLCPNGVDGAQLCISLETGIPAPTRRGLWSNAISGTFDDNWEYAGPVGLAPPAKTVNYNITYEYVDGVVGQQTEAFIVGPNQKDGSSGDNTITPISITPDKWHHLLFSFDVSGGCQTHGNTVSGSDDARHRAAYVDRYATLYVAFDDVNYTADKFSPYWQSGMPDNGVLTSNAVEIAGSSGGQGDNSIFDPVTNLTYNIFNHGLELPQYNLPDGSVPIDGHDFGIPSTEQFVNKIFKVQMAECVIFPDVLIDTNQVANRRLFVDAKGKPVKTEIAEKALGRPAIRLHKNTNWIKGNNTGSLGQNADGKDIPSGDFTPTGVIKKFKPEPELGK